MKANPTLVLLFTLLAASTSWAYNPSIHSLMTVPYSLGQEVTSLTETADDGLLIAGGTVDVNQLGDSDILLAKINSSGQVQWTTTIERIGGPFYDGTHAHGVVESADGEFYLTGQYINHGGRAWVIKTNAQGDEVWQHVYDKNGLDDVGGDAYGGHAGGITVTSTGLIVFTGESFWSTGEDESHHDVQTLVIALDSSGTPVWNRVYGDFVNAFQYGTDIVATGDGLYVVGQRRNGGEYNILLQRLDFAGNQVWERVLTALDGNNELADEIVACTDGGFLISGLKWASAEESYDWWLIKVNATGDVLWERTFPPDGNPSDDVHGITATSDGHMLATRTLDNGSIEVRKINNANGADFWVKTQTSDDPEKRLLAAAVIETRPKEFAWVGLKARFFWEEGEDFSDIVFAPVVDAIDPVNLVTYRAAMTNHIFLNWNMVAGARKYPISFADGPPGTTPWQFLGNFDSTGVVHSFSGIVQRSYEIVAEPRWGSIAGGYPGLGGQKIYYPSFVTLSIANGGMCPLFSQPPFGIPLITWDVPGSYFPTYGVPSGKPSDIIGAQAACGTITCADRILRQGSGEWAARRSDLGCAWSGSLESNGSMVAGRAYNYINKSGVARTVVLAGLASNSGQYASLTVPANATIPLSWRSINYLSVSALGLLASGFTGGTTITSSDKLTDQNTGNVAWYRTTDATWQGTLATLTPGRAYSLQNVHATAWPLPYTFNHVH